MYSTDVLLNIKHLKYNNLYHFHMFYMISTVCPIIYNFSAQIAFLQMDEQVKISSASVTIVTKAESCIWCGVSDS